MVSAFGAAIHIKTAQPLMQGLVLEKKMNLKVGNTKCSHKYLICLWNLPSDSLGSEPGKGVFVAE